MWPDEPQEAEPITKKMGWREQNTLIKELKA